MKAVEKVQLHNQLPAQLEPLLELAQNLRWSWRAETKQLFKEIDPQLWEDLAEDPLQLLRHVRISRLHHLASDEAFLGRLKKETNNLHTYLSAKLWYQKTASAKSTGKDPLVAYFSMEFGIHPSLPIYSGGLGVLAGDHLKSASDLGVPLIGVGLLYSQGYFQQSLSDDGWQQENYEYHDPSQLPLTELKDSQGAPVSVTVTFPENQEVTLAVWVAQVGRVPLLLLDSNIAQNPEHLRAVTDRLYGGDSEHRIQQELVLGIGGVRAVHAFCQAQGIKTPPLAHLNEGHAGFSSLERIRERMQQGLSFEAALAQVRASSIFTTHTPVPAGIDRFEKDLVARYVGADPEIPLQQALNLGSESDPQRFNMAHLGLRVSQLANGVAKLHGEVSRNMFADLYPGFEAFEVPIGHVTNGVHLPTWIKPEMQKLVDKAADGAAVAVADSWPHPEAVKLEKLWKVRNKLRAELVEVARTATSKSWQARGHNAAELAWTQRVLDPEVLTVGFARRVSTYKRLTLMLRNPERLRAILLNESRPVQFVIAGKAHPNDEGGKKLMQEIVHFADHAGVRDRFLFLPDYDLTLAGTLVAGADIWLNNPVRPQEASGTSGMKAVMNGGLTLSISDGWWDEMPQAETGWTIPTVDSGDGEYRDAAESEALYDLLSNDIVPLFYERDKNGVPQRWLEKVRHSWVTLSPQVSSTRMVREYTDNFYRRAVPQTQTISDANTATDFAAWLERIKGAWSEVSVDDLQLSGPAHTGQPLKVSVRAKLGTLIDEEIAVEILFGPIGASGEIENPQIMHLIAAADGIYTGTISSEIPGELGINARIVPAHPLLLSPAETGLSTYFCR